MRLVSPSEMRLLERQAEADYGLPTITMMENAGARLADMAAQMLGGLAGKTVVVVAGPGNNGGDGFVAARHLAGRGAQVRVHTTGRESELKGDALTNYQILSHMSTHQEIVLSHLAESRGLAALEKSLAASELVIDALLGTGLRGPITGLVAAVIRSLNASGKPVLAADIPSGLDALTGQVLMGRSEDEKESGGAIRASVTLTFGLPKVGLYLYPGADYTGEVVVADIGLPIGLASDPALHMELITAGAAKALLPARPAYSHKGTFGHALLVGGSPGLTGAIALAGEAALRAGAGLATAAIPASLNPILEVKLTEVMTLPLPEREGFIAEEAFEVLSQRARRATAVAVGPGLGTSQETAECLRMLLGEVAGPLLVDADGLRILAAHADVFRVLFQTRDVPPVLTPHPGEMAGLMGLSTEAVEKYRIDTAREMAQQWKSIVVLKGAHTVIAAPSGQLYLNPTGNPGLATAGTGDVLAGLIAGLLAQGLTPVAAALAGVYLHGLAGDIGADKIGQASLTAGDVLGCIPLAFARILESLPERDGALVRPR